MASLGGPAAIERHTSALRAWMYEQLSGLRHSKGAPLLRILGRHHWPNRHVWAGRVVGEATFKGALPDVHGRAAAAVLCRPGLPHVRRAEAAL